MEILKDFKNDLLSRREIKVVAQAGKTPSFEEALKIVAAEFKSPEEDIVINNVKGKFGRKTFLIDASIYLSKEIREKTEPKPKEKKEKRAEGEEAKPAEKK